MISSVVYTSVGSAVRIVMDDGTTWSEDAALPPDTDIRRQLAEWLAAGGVIAPFVAPSPETVLEPLTARQLRLGLLKIGIKPADVSSAIAALPADQQDAAEIEWDYASEYRRDHPLIAALGDYFGLTADQIDAAWRDAMAL